MDELGPYVVHPIGVVRSTLHTRADAPKQAFAGAPEALLEFDPAFADALHRVQPGDELILLTWLHLADRDVLQTHPTGNTSIPLTGVFRTRSPNRPNPIGVHRVTVTTLEGPTSLRVRALEAIDGPLTDLSSPSILVERHRPPYFGLCGQRSFCWLSLWAALAASWQGHSVGRCFGFSTRCPLSWSGPDSRLASTSGSLC